MTLKIPVIKKFNKTIILLKTITQYYQKVDLNV